MPLTFHAFAPGVPSATLTGVLAYDTDTETIRVYRAAADDVRGIAGWHSLTPGYELWKNKCGATVSPGMVVTSDPTVAHSEFIYPQAVKDANVIGVVAETITDSALGLIQTLTAGRVVTILVETETHAVADGDGLVANAADDSNARSVGANSASIRFAVEPQRPAGDRRVDLGGSPALLDVFEVQFVQPHVLGGPCKPGR